MLTQSSVLTSLNQLDLKKDVMEHNYDKGIAIEHIQIKPHNQFKIALQPRASIKKSKSL
ncbi:MAG: hypothetical protein ACJAS1_006797 [Oleiphilaceae bacterium]|jgi:hypothetical protein